MAEIFNFSTFGKKRKKIVWVTKKITKDKMTGNVYILWHIVEIIIEKKIKDLSHRTQESRILNVFFFSNLPKTMFFRCDLIFNFIDPSGYFVFYKKFKLHSPRWCSWGTPVSWIKKYVDKYQNTIQWKN